MPRKRVSSRRSALPTFKTASTPPRRSVTTGCSCEANASVDPDTFTHGTSTQRQRWFTRGYDSGLQTRKTFIAAGNDALIELEIHRFHVEPVRKAPSDLLANGSAEHRPHRWLRRLAAVPPMRRFGGRLILSASNCVAVVGRRFLVVARSVRMYDATRFRASVRSTLRRRRSCATQWPVGACTAHDACRAARPFTGDERASPRKHRGGCGIGVEPPGVDLGVVGRISGTRSSYWNRGRQRRSPVGCRAPEHVERDLHADPVRTRPSSSASHPAIPPRSAPRRP